MTPFAPVRMAGPAVIVGAPVTEGDGLRVCHGVMMHAGAPTLCTVREVFRVQYEDDEDFAYRAHQLLLRARLLRSLDGMGAPRLLAAVAGNSGLLVSIEESQGGVGLVELLASQAKTVSPPGLALLVVRHLSQMWERAARFEVPHPNVTREDVFLTWDGRAQSLYDSAVLERQVMSAGAMIAIVPERVGYRAPEQVRGLPASDSISMFNCGLFLFEALTGRDPFGGASGFKLITEIVTANVLPLEAHRAGLPPAVLSFFRRCTQREAADRYATWAEFRAALEAAARSVEPFDEGALAAFMAKQFPQSRAAAAVLEDLAAAFDMQAARKQFTGAADDPTVVQPYPPRAATTASPETRSEDVTWEGNDARPMLRAGSLFVDRRPVSNAEYARFVSATGRAPPRHWEGRATPPLELEESPVTFVTQVDAVAYAAWAGKRLPEDHEWGLMLQHLGAERLGTGTVWEWTATARQSGSVVRGGVWRDRPDLFSAASSSWESRPTRDVGFRCVRDV
ncbi:MAG: SUMF1/EgtB/PvdO family nonheme iron enzyme [Archangium sp.]|nr:SUMF1/EgtB/PvdO family nonheme iron enzyme [Archangium sp.]